MDCINGDAKKRHNYFLSQMTKKNAEVKKNHRIILIGTGESGKSTFVKQMKLLSNRNQTFDDNYKMKFKPELQRNLIQALSAILEFMDTKNIDFKGKNSKTKTHKKRILKIQAEIEANPDVIIHYAENGDKKERETFYDMCKEVWADETIQEVYKRSNEYQIIDCAQYVLDKVDEIRNPEYKPSDADVLQCRTKTLGIHTEQINYNNVTFELVDVGGQREQRSKWIEAMSDGVTAVIFLTDVSAYDMTLEEDQVTNRLRESIELLEEVWKKNPLRDKSIILFLNKQDKLEKKVRFGRTAIDNYFPEFNVHKSQFVYQIIKELRDSKIKRSKKETEIWDSLFAYFLPQPVAKKDARPSEDAERAKSTREETILGEFAQIQLLVRKAFHEKMVDTWFGDRPEDQNLCQAVVGQAGFIEFQKKLMEIPFFQVVSITHFLQHLFVIRCQQTTTRHIYPYPTTAIDKRNVDRVFDACKDIMQGKILTDIMA